MAYTQSDVEKAFKEHEIVPDLLKRAPTKGFLQISYPSGITVELGKELTPTQGKDRPTVTWEAEKGAYYTIFMVDPDAPTRENRELGDARHWLVVNIPGTDIEKGDEVIEFVGSGCPKGSGLHRYITLVFKQTGFFAHDEPRSKATSLAHRLKTSTSELVNKYNLGDPEFGNFYLAQYDEYVDIIHAKTTDAEAVLASLNK